MRIIAQIGMGIKYGHSEAGSIYDGDRAMEQHEIEFLPVGIEDAADQIVVAKWVLTNVGRQHGVTISFAPKILLGHAGSGLHIHTRLTKGGKNMMVEDSQLSDVAKKTIAGYLALAPSLTSFGNTVPTSYFRLVPHQEAPTHICWGYGNRSALVRVPLGWLNVGSMVEDANPHDNWRPSEPMDDQTVEFRCPDGSANIHLLLAGLAVAARHGLERDDALEMADELYVDGNIFSSDQSDRRRKLPQLPASCWESSESLLRNRGVYERDGVFPALVIDWVVRRLKGYNDKDLSKRLGGKEDDMKKLLNEYLHC